jgi:hypothetical protein
MDGWKRAMKERKAAPPQFFLTRIFLSCTNFFLKKRHITNVKITKN